MNHTTFVPALKPAVAALGVLAFLLPANIAGACGTALTTRRVAAGLSAPLYAAAPPGDTERLFIVEQTGAIKILNLKTGIVNPTPFVQIAVTYGGERGLLGLAFDPNYAANRRFYVNYTKTVSNQLKTFISRFTTLENDPNIADPNSEFVILTIDQPYSNHNGGWVAFGPDGYLYIGMGDGGSGGDPQNRAQNLDELLGKLLRIDVRNAAPGNPYEIPPDNPFVGKPGRDEIWAYGLRNPWRCSFDRFTSDLYIADVGQNAWEEIDFQTASSPGGENYGWRCYEGNAPYNTGGCPPPETMVFPIHVYGHNPQGGFSVSGGYVYRGKKIWDLRGTYFFADYVSERIWSFRYDGQKMTDFRDRTTELAPGGGQSIDSISSFAEDANGELYICDLGGEVFKIIPNGPVVGDLNGDDAINNFDIDPFVLALSDPVAYRLKYPNINPDVIGDINCDGQLDNFDIDPFVKLLTL